MKKPLLLSFRHDDGSQKRLRLDPRLQQVQELDPGPGEVTSTITTIEPPAELGGGSIDGGTVTIRGREIHWSRRLDRPRFVAGDRAIHPWTCACQGEGKLQRIQRLA